MCKLQSVLLACAIVCTQTQMSEASPPWRADPDAVNSNEKSPSAPLALESRPVVSKAATKAQERRHHLGLITDAAKDDFTENAGKEDEIGYLRSFNEKGAGGYDHYEAFHKQDKAEYEHENLEHTENEKDEKEKSHKALSAHHTEEKEDDEEENDYDEEEEESDSNAENEAKTVKSQQESLGEDDREKDDQSDEQEKSHFQQSCKSCTPKNTQVSSDEEKSVEESNNSESASTKAKRYNSDERYRGARVQVKPGGYEVYEYPDEGERATSLGYPHSNDRHHDHHPAFTYPKEDSRYYHNRELTNERQGGGGGGGGYEAYIVHDKKVDESDTQGADLGGRGKTIEINYHYPTLETSRNESTGAEKNHEESDNYGNGKIKTPHEEEDGDEDDDRKSNLGEKGDLDVNAPILNDYNGDKDDTDTHVQTEEDDYPSDDIDYYDDRTYNQQRNSNYENNTNDPNDYDYVYTDSKQDKEPATFQEEDKSNNDKKELVSTGDSDEYYDDDEGDDEDEEEEDENNLKDFTKPSNSGYVKDENEIVYDYISDADTDSEDEYD